MSDPLHSIFAFAAAVQAGESSAMRAAASKVESEWGEGACREVLRQLHLYFGFPRMVQALNLCLPVIGAATDADLPEPAPSELRAAGEAVFRELYAEDADKVLPHLDKLDPTLRAWILEHAYARVLARPRLSLAEKERLAVACLAATRCWKQWESHHSIARRHGVALSTLRSDLHAIRSWIGAEAEEHARKAFEALD